MTALVTTLLPARRSSGLTANSPAPGAAVRLAGVGTATPPRRVSRQDVVEVLPGIWPQLARRTSMLIDPLDDGYRHLLRDPAEMVEALSLGEQTARYVEAAPELAAAAAERAITAAGDHRENIGLLMVASCTGFILPGLDAHLLPKLGLRSDVAGADAAAGLRRRRRRSGPRRRLGAHAPGAAGAGCGC